MDEASRRGAVSRTILDTSQWSLRHWPYQARKIGSQWTGAIHPFGACQNPVVADFFFYDSVIRCARATKGRTGDATPNCSPAVIGSIEHSKRFLQRGNTAVWNCADNAPFQAITIGAWAADPCHRAVLPCLCISPMN
jgi:hypothetical protein